MDSTQIASRILNAIRLHLGVEAVQRFASLMSDSQKASAAEWLGPFTRGDAGQYTYRVKGKEATAEHLQRVGEALYRLLQLLKSEQGQEVIYQVGQRFFAENFQVAVSESVHA